MNSILEKSLHPDPHVNLALGIERHDLGKILRAIHAGADPKIDHICYKGNTPYDDTESVHPSQKHHFKNAFDLAVFCDLPEEGMNVLRQYLLPPPSKL